MKDFEDKEVLVSQLSKELYNYLESPQLDDLPDDEYCDEAKIFLNMYLSDSSLDIASTLADIFTKSFDTQYNRDDFTNIEFAVRNILKKKIN